MNLPRHSICRKIYVPKVIHIMFSPIVIALIQNIESEEDRSFVEELYLKYRDVMYERAYQVLHNESDAEDAVSETIKNVIINLDKFDRSKESIKRQLYIYAKNASINIYKKNKRISEEKEIYDENTGASEQSAESAAINQINKALALKAAEKLPDTQKEPFYLFYFENYTYKEIASILNISTSAVGMRITRAKETIRRALENCNT